jgi:DNA polymerase III epsilon subunit-like protein
LNRSLVLDFETSGVEHKRHAPVSLGIALMDGAEVIDSKEWIIGPKLHYKTGAIEREYSISALEISGITWKQIKDAPSPLEICVDVAKVIHEWGAHEMLTVAWNAPFDFAWYSELLFMAGGFNRSTNGFAPFPPFISGPWQCAMMATKIAFPDLLDYKLDTVAKKFGLSRSTEKHGALEDAILCGQIYNQINQGVPA